VAVSERAGRPADPSILVDIDRLMAAYHEAPDPSDSTKLASCSQDKTIKVWNTASGQLIHTLNGHSDNVQK